MPCKNQLGFVVEDFSKKKIVKQSNNILFSEVRKESSKLKTILNDLQKFSVEQSQNKLIRQTSFQPLDDI